MSKWVNFGTVISGASGAILAAVAVLQFVGPKRVEGVDDAVASLERIAEAIEAGRLDLDTPGAPEELLRAARPVTDLLSRNLNAIPNEDVADLPDIKDARPGETVEFLHVDGHKVQVTFQNWSMRPPSIRLSYEGKSIITSSGWQEDVRDTECTIIFAGPTRDPEPLARFRLDCPT